MDVLFFRFFAFTFKKSWERVETWNLLRFTQTLSCTYTYLQSFLLRSSFVCIIFAGNEISPAILCRVSSFHNLSPATTISSDLQSPITVTYTIATRDGKCSNGSQPNCITLTLNIFSMGNASIIRVLIVPHC